MRTDLPSPIAAIVPIDSAAARLSATGVETERAITPITATESDEPPRDAARQSRLTLIANTLAESEARALVFERSEQSGRYVQRVIDETTGEVVLELPIDAFADPDGRPVARSGQVVDARA
jgi:FlaG protein.